MAAGYVQNRIEATATFELVVRHLLPHRNFLVAAGLEQALECLEQMRFTEKEVVGVRDLPFFRHHSLIVAYNGATLSGDAAHLPFPN